jgi:iron(III) transport system permease protein
MQPAISAAAILVFVDTVKELSATILLRPFGFNTLATYVYENASRGVVEDGAAAADHHRARRWCQWCCYRAH